MNLHKFYEHAKQSVGSTTSRPFLEGRLAHRDLWAVRLVQAPRSGGSRSWPFAHGGAAGSLSPPSLHSLSRETRDNCASRRGGRGDALRDDQRLRRGAG